MTLESNALCTVAEVQRKFGRDAMRSWSDHDQDHVPDDDVIEDAINQATGEILFYLSLYSAASVASSSLLNRWAVTLAGYFLSMDRGNPAPDSLEMEFQRIMEKLAAVQAGKAKIPGLNFSSRSGPTMSNLKIDSRWRHSKVRVTPANSTNVPTELTQDTAYEGPALFD